jgi:hypothetical protein
MDLDPSPVREVAFGRSPGSPVPIGVADPVHRWLAAVALGGQGRYAAAAALLEGLLDDPPTSPAVAAHAAVTTASHRRQLGGHAAARRYDALGLRLATSALDGRAPAAGPDQDGTDALAARIDALVGLAADAVGHGAAMVAARLLDAPGESLQGHPGWRPGVRLGWVRAELALVRGRPGAAVEAAEHALAVAERAGAVRHVLKSGIVLTVARGAVSPDRAVVAELDRLAAEAQRHAQLPLVWPARLAAADLLDHHADGGVPVDPEVEELSPERPTALPNAAASGAAHRRHAATAAVNVIHRRSDPVGRRLMGESPWAHVGESGTVATPFGVLSPT